MQSKIYSTSGAVLMLLAAVYAQAGTHSKQALPPSNHLFATLNLGPTWARGGVSQAFYLESDVRKKYDAKVGNRGTTNLGLFLGMQREIRERLDGQIGLAFVATTRAFMTGDVWEDANPKLNNYGYQYKVRHSHVAIKGKLVADIKQAVRPYLGASLGLGRNRAQNFVIAPKIVEEVPAPIFNDHSTSAFTYTFEAGFQQAISDNWKIGFGYEFSDWGKSHLAAATGQTLNTGIRLSHVYTNGLQFNLTYLA